MNDITKMTRNEQVSYWIGVLCLAIGNGSFRDQVSLMIDFYQKEAYERGIKVGQNKI